MIGWYMYHEILIFDEKDFSLKMLMEVNLIPMRKINENIIMSNAFDSKYIPFSVRRLSTPPPPPPKKKKDIVLISL